MYSYVYKIFFQLRKIIQDISAMNAPHKLILINGI